MATATTTTTPSPAAKAAKSPPAPPYPVSEETAKALAAMREGLSASKLGHLGRRIEMQVRDAQETIDTYGAKVIVAKLGGKDVPLPVKTTIGINVAIECNGITQTYAFGVGPATVAPRPETKLDSFPSEQ